MKSKTCLLPGCTRPCHPGFQYCGRSHGVEHQKMLQQQPYQKSPHSNNSSNNSNSSTSLVSSIGSVLSWGQGSNSNGGGGGSSTTGSAKSTTYTSTGSASASATNSSSYQLPNQRVFPKDLVLLSRKTPLSRDDIGKLSRKCSKIGLSLMLDPKLTSDITRRTLCELPHDYKGPIQSLISQVYTQYQHSVQTVHFYNANECFYEFTNFYPVPVILQNRKWPTTEHFFQAQKFNDERTQEHVRKLKTPREAFTFSRQSGQPIRSDWDKVKVDVMHDAVYAKFSQNYRLKQLLLLTGGATLVEHTANDSFWGDGGNGSGKNMLGKVLMDVREILRSRDDTKYYHSSSSNDSSNYSNGYSNGTGQQFFPAQLQQQQQQQQQQDVAIQAVSSTSNASAATVMLSNWTVPHPVCFEHPDKVFLVALDDKLVTLHQGPLGSNHQWIMNVNSGTIESVKHPGHVLTVDPQGNVQLEAVNPENKNQRWLYKNSMIASQSTDYVLCARVNNNSGAPPRIVMSYGQLQRDQMFLMTHC